MVTSGPVFSSQDGCASGSVAGIYLLASERDNVPILADSSSGNPLSYAPLEKILFPTILAWELGRGSPTLGSGGEKALWVKTSKD